MIYQASLSIDKNLVTLQPDYGSFSKLGDQVFRDRVWQILTSVEAVNRLIGSVSAAPSRPPVAAVESLLVEQLGTEAFFDEAKKMIGRLIRQIIERLGGRFIRRGVPLNIESNFSKGSIYSF